MELNASKTKFLTVSRSGLMVFRLVSIDGVLVENVEKARLLSMHLIALIDCRFSFKIYVENVCFKAQRATFALLKLKRTRSEHN